MGLQLVDDRIKQITTDAQKIIDNLSEKEKVPTIPVIFKETLENPSMGAVFDGEKYQIEITNKIGAHALVHEFTHYLVRLLDISEDMEERLVERSARHLENELKDDDNLLKMLNEINKKLNELNE